MAGPRELYASGEFSGKANEVATLHAPAALSAKRAVLIGLGKADKAEANSFRKAGGAIVRALKAKGILDIAFVLPAAHYSAAVAQALFEGAVAGDYEPDLHKSKRMPSTPSTSRCLLRELPVTWPRPPAPAPS